MKKEHELTEKLKVLETQIYDAKIDLHGINSKLNTAYKYEDNLALRQNAAKLKTEEVRKDFFQKSNEINNLYCDMKNIFDVFTGNYYNDVTI